MLCTLCTGFTYASKIITVVFICQDYLVGPNVYVSYLTLNNTKSISHPAFCWGNRADGNVRVGLQKYIISASLCGFLQWESTKAYWSTSVGSALSVLLTLFFITSQHPVAIAHVADKHFDRSSASHSCCQLHVLPFQLSLVSLPYSVLKVWHDIKANVTVSLKNESHLGELDMLGVETKWK